MTSKRIEQNEKVPADMWGRVDAAIKAVAGAVRSVHEQTSSSDFEAAAKAAEAVRMGIERLRGLSDEIASTERSFKERADRYFSELETDLRAAVGQRGWKTDGSWPSLYVERGIAIEIDEKSRSVKVGGRKLANPTGKSVMAALDALVAVLVPKKFVPQDFIDRLATAYDDVKGSKSQAPIFDVYRGLVVCLQAQQFWRDARTDRFQELSLDQFRARLSRCLETGCTLTADRRELRMLPPLDPREGVFVYQPAELRFAFVGRIEFSGT